MTEVAHLGLEIGNNLGVVQSNRTIIKQVILILLQTYTLNKTTGTTETAYTAHFEAVGFKI